MPTSYEPYCALDASMIAAPHSIQFWLAFAVRRASSNALSSVLDSAVWSSGLRSGYDRQRG
jgi:hypothetical protein